MDEYYSKKIKRYKNAYKVILLIIFFIIFPPKAEFTNTLHFKYKPKIETNIKLNHEELVSKEFKLKVIEICDSLSKNGSKINPNELMNIMKFESNLKTKSTQKLSNAIGLIQFTNSTLKRLKLDKNKVYNMSDIEQLDIVKLYFEKILEYKKIKNSADLYMAIFCPSAIGKSINSVAYSKFDGDNYLQNSPLDLNSDGMITIKEAISKINK